MRLRVAEHQDERQFSPRDPNCDARPLSMMPMKYILFSLQTV
jgi:hypothetical protein